MYSIRSLRNIDHLTGSVEVSHRRHFPRNVIVFPVSTRGSTNIWRYPGFIVARLVRARKRATLSFDVVCTVGRRGREPIAAETEGELNNYPNGCSLPALVKLPAKRTPGIQVHRETLMRSNTNKAIPKDPPCLRETSSSCSARSCYASIAKR